jgi:hypothetical protein
LSVARFLCSLCPRQYSPSPPELSAPSVAPFDDDAWADLLNFIEEK